MNKKTLLITLLVVVIVGAGAFFVFGKDYFGTKYPDTPGQRLINAYLKTSEAKSYEATQLMTMTANSGEENIDFKMAFDMKMQNDKNLVTIIADVMNTGDKNFGSIYFDMEKIMLNLGEFYEYNIYLKWNDTMKLLKNYIPDLPAEFLTIKFEDYIKVLTNASKNKNLKKVNEEDYMTAVRTFLDARIVENIEEVITVNEKEITAEKFVIEMNSKDTLQLLVDLLKIAQTDPGLKAFVKDITSQLMNVVVKNGDYAAFDLTKEQFESVRDVLLASIDTSYNEMIGQVITVYEASIAQLGAENLDDTMQTVYYIDSNGYIAKTAVEQETSQDNVSVKMIADQEYLSINKNVTIDSEIKEGDIDLATISQDELMGIFAIIGQNYMQFFQTLESLFTEVNVVA